MRKYNSLFFSVLLFLIACAGNSIPPGIIKQEQMGNLLTEIHIIDGGVYNVMQDPDTVYKYSIGKYLAIFKKFNTDSAQFKKSFRYYSLHPEILSAIYDKVTINLKQKTDSLTKINQLRMAKDNKRRSDSLAKTLKNSPGQQPVNLPKQKTYIPYKRPNKNAIPDK
jgi:hypothetical protein